MLGCSTESRLRQDGPTPYVRCVAGPEPAARTIRAGEWTFTVKDRVLDIAGPARALRIAALSNAGIGGAPSSHALSQLREAAVDLVVSLGGAGDDAAAASATLKALASLSTPSLVVLGGRDTWSAHEKAFAELPGDARIINATVLRAIRIGSNTFVPLAGAEKGRYAVQATACGFDLPDLDQAAEELGGAAARESRWLLSWQAPTRVGPVLGPQSEFGTALGSTLVTRFAEKVGAKGGLYAWPADETGAVRVGPLGAASVPRLFGPRFETAAGARLAHALLLLEVSADTVRVVL